MVRASPQPEAVEDNKDHDSTLRTAILAASSALVLPVAVVTYIGGSLPGVIVQAAGSVNRSNVSQSAARIAAYATLAALGGVGASVVLAVSGVVNLATVRLGRPSPWLRRYSSGVLAACGLLAGWILVRALAGFRALE